jgi:twitching motility protein PilU
LRLQIKLSGQDTLGTGMLDNVTLDE